ncbi:hypothetical protein [Aeoliella sp.]|uniref:hypothetical protein n=1 Tax=Aeoliella sp. TaxID=2795800 RepID=UPI003CCBF84F
MSMGDPSADPIDDGRWLRNTIRTLVAVILVVFLLYLTFGKTVYEWAESDRQNQIINDRIDKIEDQTKQQDQFLDSVRNQLSSGETLDDSALQKIQERLNSLEQSARLRADIVDSLKTQASELEGERVRNRVNVIEAYEIGRRIESEISALKKELDEWQDLVAPLSSNDAGRRIATRPELLQQYAALSDVKMATFDDLDRWQRQFDTLFSRIKLAHGDQSIRVVVTPDDITAFQSLDAQVNSAFDQLRQQVRALQLIMAKADGLDPGQQTLADTIAAVQRERDEQFRQKLSETTRAEIRKVDEEFAAKIAAEQREQRRLLKEQELAAEQLETQERAAELAAIEKRNEELRARLALEKLKAEYQADLSEIESLLAPFLDSAITQPTKSNPIAKGGPMKPTSLNALKGSGALDDSSDGLNLLYQAGGHPANMRKKGGFPSFVSLQTLGQGSERDKVRRAQQLLVKYGELMVEDGLLSK